MSTKPRLLIGSEPGQSFRDAAADQRSRKLSKHKRPMGAKTPPFTSPPAQIRYFERVDWRPSSSYPPDPGEWPFSVPAVAQLVVQGGLEIPPGVTFLIGENGSGKSTLIEALARTYPRDGIRNPFVNLLGPEESTEDSALHYNLKAKTHRMASRAGFFLRAEMMHGFAASVDADRSQQRAWGGEKLQERSHGESFLTVLRYRFSDPGVYFMDEPESALSFQSCLSLVRLLDLMRSEGSQVIVSTHSPILVTLPNAHLFELGPWGMRQVDSYSDLELIKQWKDFLDAPERFLRHLLDP